MTANEKDNEENVKDESVDESAMDTSAYYAQGETDENPSTDDLYKPVPEINEDEEEMSFLKTMAFLGFGLGALSIIFILFFMHDLDERILNMDSAVAKLDKKLEPFKKEITESVVKVGSHVAQLEEKVGNFERTQAIMELKRALMTVQKVTSETNADVQSKSGEVVSSIQALLQEFEGQPSAAKFAEKGAPIGPPADEAPTVLKAPTIEPPADPATEQEQTGPADISKESTESATKESGDDVGEIELVAEDTTGGNVDEAAGGEEELVEEGTTGDNVDEAAGDEEELVEEDE